MTTKVPVELFSAGAGFTIGSGAAEDTKIVFDGNAQDYYIGLDDTYDDLVIGKGSAVGTTPAISINENEDVCINGFSYALAGGAANYGNLTINGTEGGILEFADDGVLSSFIAALDGSFQMLHQLAEPMLIGTNNAEAMRITSDNKIGIGTTSPAGKLHITNTGGGATPANYVTVEGATANNSNYPAIEVKGGTLANVYPAYGLTNGGLGTWITAGYHTTNYNVRAAWSVNNGTLGGYTSSGTSYVATFQVGQNGTTYTNDGSVGSLSDERVKTDIKDLTDGLEIVKQLRPVTFKYNDNSTDDEGNLLMASASDKTRYGFIAQEVEKVAPQYVETITRKIKNVEVDDFKTLSATKMIPMLFKAIQEQQTQIEALQSEVNTLKGG